ncbi:MAG: hypothetical protein HY235_28070 [Acidobacteria bacterium]|nr:hypothetical protein [Acidobacteriota bacterium]
MKRVRAVRVRPEAFYLPSLKAALSKRPERQASAFETEFNLFSDVRLSVTWTGVDRTDDFSGYVWKGAISGDPKSHAVLIVDGERITGNIARGDGTIYQIRTAADGTQWVREIDQSQFQDGNDAIAFDPGGQGSTGEREATAERSADDGSVIDVLVVYNAAAKTKAGGAQAILQQIQLAIAETNQGYSNSGVLHRLRLVQSAEVVYQESGELSKDLTRLRQPDDGFMDDVHRLRDLHRADVVSLWISGGDACGMGYLPSAPNRITPEIGFSVVTVECATGYYSFGHEIGHNMGATHGRDDGTGPGLYAYSYAYKQTSGDKFRTIMAYNTNCLCPRINYWSNPSARYNGQPVGIDPNAANGAANFQTLNNTRLAVAGFRESNPGGGTGGGTGGGGGGGGFPESDHPYADNTDRTWTFTLPGSAASLNVTFDSRTSVEPGYDFIHVLDANSRPIPGSPFSGNQLAGRTVTVTGSTVRIRLVTDDSVTDYGFKVTAITGTGGGAQPLPRLVVTELRGPVTGEAGRSLTGVTSRIANQGNGPAGAFRFGFYFSSDASISTADTFSGWSCTFQNGLAAGAASTCNGDVGVPENLPPGTWYLGGIADDQNQVPQSDRSGNSRAADTGALRITGGTPGSILSPAPGSVLASTTVTFQWSPGTGVSSFILAIGTTPTGTNVFNRDAGTSLSATVTTIPSNGETLYVRLSSRIGADLRTNSYVYRAPSLGGVANRARLVITSFSAPNSATVGVNLTGTALRVENQGNASSGAFRIGYYYSQSDNVTTRDTFSGWFCTFGEGLDAGEAGTCSGDVGVPTSLSPGDWFLAAIADDQNRITGMDRGGATRRSDNGLVSIAGRGAAELISPAPGSTLTSSAATFRWTSVPNAEQYFLAIGSSAGQSDYLGYDASTATSANVTSLPTNGRTLYVRLLTRFGEDWYSNDYTLRAFNAGAGLTPRIVITSFTAPAQGTAGASLQGMRLEATNQGNGATGAFRVGFYFGRNARVTTSDVYSGWVCNVANGISPGGTYTCTGEIGIPQSLAAGQWYVAAIADDLNQVPQPDRSGSTRVNDNGLVTIAAAAGGSVLPESSHPYADNEDRTWIYTAARNPAAIRVTFDSRTSLEEGYDFLHISNAQGAAIAASPFTGTQLAGRSVIVSGNTVRIRLVTDDSVTDWGFRVTSIEPATASPQLVVTSFTAPTTGIIGGRISGMRAVVQNQGSVAARAFEFAFYWGRSPTVTTRDEFSGWYCDVEDGLQAGETFTCTGEIGIPSSLTPGTWYVAAIADHRSVVDQLDRSGNSRTNQNGATVLSPPADEPFSQDQTPSRAGEESANGISRMGAPSPASPARRRP